MGSGWILLSAIFSFLLEGLRPRLVAGYFARAALVIFIGARMARIVPAGLAGAGLGNLSTLNWSAN